MAGTRNDTITLPTTYTTLYAVVHDTELTKHAGGTSGQLSPFLYEKTLSSVGFYNNTNGTVVGTHIITIGY